MSIRKVSTTCCLLILSSVTGPISVLMRQITVLTSARFLRWPAFKNVCLALLPDEQGNAETWYLYRIYASYTEHVNKLMLLLRMIVYIKPFSELLVPLIQLNILDIPTNFLIFAWLFEKKFTCSQIRPPFTGVIFHVTLTCFGTFLLPIHHMQFNNILFESCSFIFKKCDDLLAELVKKASYARLFGS